LGDAPVGVDTLVSTRHGVVGVRVDWPAQLNDAGYLLPFNPSSRKDTPIYLLDKTWKRLDDESQPGPQNLYEMTSLAYDSKRDQVILHGGGARRDEIWTFDMAKKRWEEKRPTGQAPTCTREAVYILREDVFLTYGPSPEDPTVPALHAWHVGANTWRRVSVPPMTEIESPRRASQNRAMVYDAERDLVLLVLGTGGDAGKAYVYAMRYRNASR
ncbi:MAG: hypothetical protein HY238_21125, partial [Acidobacteria bacterium]|nr:hypothetical protein [Acidobacteriota bacterium]